MLLIIIILSIVAGLSFYLCNRYFDKNETVKQSQLITRIIFMVTLILSNLFIFCIILLVLNVDSFQTKSSNILFWNIFLVVFTICFYYLIPLYFFFSFINWKTLKGILSITGLYFLYLILSNIIYNFYRDNQEKYLFDFGFYTSYTKLLEYLSFFGNIISATNCSYNHVFNVSIFLVYPLLKKNNLINKRDDEIKKRLENINDQISLKETKLIEMIEMNNKSTVSTDSNNSLDISSSILSMPLAKSIQSEIDSLKSVQLSYEYQLGIGAKKEKNSKYEGIVMFIVAQIKIVQSLFFIITNVIRCLTYDYEYFNKPVDLNRKSFVKVASSFSFFTIPEGLIKFVEQLISLVLVFMLFVFNISVSDTRIIGCISVIFTSLKDKVKKNNFIDLELIVACICISSYYLVCGLFVVNSMPHFDFQDKLHRILFPGFDYGKICWYYDCPYVLGLSFFVTKEIIEYSNIIIINKKKTK